MLHLSPTKIFTFEECPRRYKFIYIDGLAKFYRKDRPYFTMGENVHAALKEVYSLPPKSRTQAKLEEILWEKWAANRKGFADEQEEENFKSRALEQVRWFAQNFDLTRTPFLTEATIQEEISGLILEGRIDRVDKESHSLHLIDYKTGFKPPNPDPRALYFYGLALEKHQKHRPPVSKVSYLYLADHELITWEFNPEILSETLRWLLNIAYQISEEREFPPREGKFCRNCDFLEICPARR